MSDATPSEGWSRSPQSQRQYDFYWGLVIAVLGLILLVSSFMVQNPVPLTERGAIVVFIAVGLAVTMGMLRVQNQQDFYGGMSLMLLALTAFVASNELPGMRGFAFGPGTAPRLFALVLALLSLIVVIGGLTSKGPPISAFRIRSLVFIIASILVFAATIRTLGLVVASFACIVVCAAADEEVKWRETVIWAAILTTFCALLFPYGLNLPFQLWPRF